MEKYAYSIAEAAAKLSIGRSLAYELIRSGKLRATSIRGRRVVTARAITEFLEDADGAAPRC